MIEFILNIQLIQLVAKPNFIKNLRHWKKNMKKILSKFEKNERMDNNTSGSHQREASCFIGKVFTVGRTVVSVEDVLAEG